MADWDAVEERIEAMTEDERLRLDGLAAALGDYMDGSPDRLGMFCVPNRVVALACVDLLRVWDRAMVSRD